MREEKFEVELTDGTKKEATLVTIIKSVEKDIEYIYYAINDDDSSNGQPISLDKNVSIFASKIVTEDGKEYIKNLDNEEERQYAYNLFAQTYKKLKEDKKNN